MNFDWKDLKSVDRQMAMDLAERLGRRRFFGTMAAAALSLTAALAGRPLEAEALVDVACCTLCRSNSNCSGTCCWTWDCCAADGHVWFCKECYSSRSGCTGGCTSTQKCSQATHSGAIC
jgi:uncharacterized protein YegP (UPF0339 family)